MRGNTLGNLAIAFWILSAVLFTSATFALLEGSTKAGLRVIFQTVGLIDSTRQEIERNPEKWLGE